MKHSHDVGVEDAFNVNEIYPLGENKDDSIFLTPVASNEQLTSSQNGTAANDCVVESEAGVTSENGAGSTRRGRQCTHVPIPSNDQIMGESNSSGIKEDAGIKPHNSSYPLRSRGRIKP